MRGSWRLVVALAVAASSPARGQVGREIARAAFPSVVLIVTQDAYSQPLALGSGFFVRDTIVATNLHVVEGASSATAKLVGQTTVHAVAGVLSADTVRDLVLLVVTGARGPVLPLGDTKGVAVGDEVFAVGNPEGLEGTLSQGIISGVRQIGASRLLQMTAPISPGSSGGPVLDAHGRVIGVSVGAFREGQNLNFAVPVEALSSLVDARQSLRPLSAVPRRVTRRKGSSASPTLGVEGTLFSWGSSYGYFGYSFTVRNHLQQSVTAVKCLLVFYDAQGRPVDFRRDELWPSDTIPPGLAKRHDYSGDMNSTYQVSERVEIRVLDFTIVH